MPDLPAVQAYNMLRRLTIEADQMQQQIDQLQVDLKANLLERCVIADSIQKNGFVSEDGSILSPHYKTMKRDAVKLDEFKAKHPDIYIRCSPYLDARGAMNIIEAKYGETGAQETIRNLDPVRYIEESKVRIDDVRKTISPAERITLLEEGILYEQRYTRGEPRWEPSEGCVASMQRLKSAEKQTKPPDEEEDDE